MDDEVIDSEVIETLPVIRSAGMILPGSSPTDKLSHAMEVAKALADVIEQQRLFVSIGGKKHVLVEGWELLGSLLGVFPVVEWTRPLDNGWEARVVAKTLDGAEVGSAEMMCTRDEGRWKTADDYAIRSMSQTRAVSKSLRAPLGFVMKLAGYEPTPETEIPNEPRLLKEFDPETDLMPGAIHGEHAVREIAGALNKFDPTIDWEAVIGLAVLGKYDNAEWRTLPSEQQQDFWRRMSNMVRRVENEVPDGDFPPVKKEIIQNAFGYAFSGVAVEITYKKVETPEVVDKAPLSTEEAETIDELLAAGDDVPFGDVEEE
jgi:hypothetical protein